MKLKLIIIVFYVGNKLLISQTKENQVSTFSEITWRNKIKIQIKNEKVKLFLLNLQEFEKQIQVKYFV